jgi:hypothetical protein
MNAGAAALGERLLNEIQEESLDEVGCDLFQLFHSLGHFCQRNEWC